MFVMAMVSLSGCNVYDAARGRVVKEWTVATKEAADTLETVVDRETALAAAPRLKQIAERVRALDDEWAAIEAADEDDVEGPDGELPEVQQWLAEGARLRKEELRIVQIPEAREALAHIWPIADQRGELPRASFKGQPNP